MLRNELLEKISEVLEKTPDSSVLEVLHFAEYLLQKSANYVSSPSLTRIMADGGAFDFLANEPDLYTLNDCMEVYNK